MSGDRPATIDERSRLSIADGMIAVAAVAVALVLVSQSLPIAGLRPEWAMLVLNGLILLADFLAPTTFALLAIRLRPPSRLARQPGFAACLSACVAMVASGVFLAIIEVFARVTGTRPVVDIKILYLFVAPGAGFAVLGAWTTLATVGSWRRPASGGLERAGWLVGWGLLSLLGIIWFFRCTFRDLV